MDISTTETTRTAIGKPLQMRKRCPYIQFKTIYSTTLPYSSIKLWSEVLNVSTVFWLTTLSGRLFHSMPAL
jgi:hypothetical protein